MLIILCCVLDLSFFFFFFGCTSLNVPEMALVLNTLEQFKSPLSEIIL